MIIVLVLPLHTLVHMTFRILEYFQRFASLSYFNPFVLPYVSSNWLAIHVGVAVQASCISHNRDKYAHDVGLRLTVVWGDITAWFYKWRKDMCHKSQASVKPTGLFVGLCHFRFLLATVLVFPRGEGLKEVWKFAACLRYTCSYSWHVKHLLTRRKIADTCTVTGLWRKFHCLVYLWAYERPNLFWNPTVTRGYHPVNVNSMWCCPRRTLTRSHMSWWLACS